MCDIIQMMTDLSVHTFSFTRVWTSWECNLTCRCTRCWQLAARIAPQWSRKQSCSCEGRYRLRPVCALKINMARPCIGFYDTNQVIIATCLRKHTCHTTRFRRQLRQIESCRDLPSHNYDSRKLHIWLRIHMKSVSLTGVGSDGHRAYPDARQPPKVPCTIRCMKRLCVWYLTMIQSQVIFCYSHISHCMRWSALIRDTIFWAYAMQRNFEYNIAVSPQEAKAGYCELHCLYIVSLCRVVSDDRKARHEVGRPWEGLLHGLL